MKRESRDDQRANKELDRAIALYSRLSPKADENQRIEILLHLCRAVELWIDELLRPVTSGKSEFRTLTLRQKIEMLKREGIIQDPIILDELAQVNKLRNIVIHPAEDGQMVTWDEVSTYLQIATHFIKVKSPSSYERKSPPQYRTLTKACVRSKSEVIIANILTNLGIEYEYEKPLFGRTDPRNFRTPDFTIRYHEREFYWEHVIGLTDSEYQHSWQSKLKWYKDNGYFDRLIISKESSDRSIDSIEIENIAKKKILGLENEV